MMTILSIHLHSGPTSVFSLELLTPTPALVPTAPPLPEVLFLFIQILPTGEDPAQILLFLQPLQTTHSPHPMKACPSARKSLAGGLHSSAASFT